MKEIGGGRFFNLFLFTHFLFAFVSLFNQIHISIRICKDKILIFESLSRQRLLYSSSSSSFCYWFSLRFSSLSSSSSLLSFFIYQTLLDDIRPDLLVIRVISRSLIMWESVGNTVEYVESLCPPIVQEHGLGKKVREAKERDSDR